jgi:hypothetical protein
MNGPRTTPIGTAPRRFRENERGHSRPGRKTTTRRCSAHKDGDPHRQNSDDKDDDKDRHYERTICVVFAAAHNAVTVGGGASGSDLVAEVGRRTDRSLSRMPVRMVRTATDVGITVSLRWSKSVVVRELIAVRVMRDLLEDRTISILV